jgi:hypothetical protein
VDEYVTARADRVMCLEAFVLCALQLAKLGVTRVLDLERVIVILDHFPAPTERMAGAHAAARPLTERVLVRPGELVFGTLTPDQGGSATAAAFCDAVLRALEARGRRGAEPATP